MVCMGDDRVVGMEVTENAHDLKGFPSSFCSFQDA